MMLGEARTLELLKKVISLTEADQAEALLMSNETGLTRFANSTIHQNVFEKDAIVYLRAALGKKTGVASSNLLDEDSLKKLARTAVDIAASQVDNPDFDGFVSSPRADKVDAYFESTAACAPGKRAENVKVVIDAANKRSFLAAGSHWTAAKEIAVANSAGTEQYHKYTAGYLNTVIMSPTSSGYADGSFLDVDGFDPTGLGEEAARICADSQDPREIGEGKYDVVISEAALSSILDWLGYIGFGADWFQEGRSFMSGNIDRKIMGGNISMWDDGLDPAGLPLPFDFEGVPKQRVDLIDKGVAKGVVHNTITARRGGVTSTGHGLPPGEQLNALPLNIFVAPGNSTVEEMVASLKRGILVTRFHYINGLLDPKRALFTGMTRDGTFFVEDGKIAYPLKNLRFTHSMLEALSSVEMISRDAKLNISTWQGASVVPALKIKDFNFSGKTEF
jgi:predicted Zn-dependent protease